jgi:hypothetical protein
MTYIPTENTLGIPAIGSSSTTALVTPGTIIRATDPTYGSGEFIYLLGVAGTVRGSVVTWNGNSTGTPTYQTTLAPATANLAQPLAVAMGANLAGTYGWYQISGNAVVATNGTLATGPAPVYLAGSGQVSSTGVAGKQMVNAQNVTATGTPGTGLAVVEMMRPFGQGAIT